MAALFDVGGFLDRFSAAASPGADAENLFSTKRRAWHAVKSEEARCDFAPDRFRLNARGIMFLSLWKRSIYGRTLTEIKSDDTMPDFFADGLVPFIRRILGANLPGGDWAIVTPPPRRHLEHNFAMRCADRIASGLGIPHRRGIARSRNRQRVNAEFDLLYEPPEKNLIVFDDIVTTGSTFVAMDNLLGPLGKATVFVTGINNK